MGATFGFDATREHEREVTTNTGRPSIAELPLPGQDATRR
jgi:hypothetical protein